MNTKLFLAAALMGAFAFTSCVDDTESASVQALRTAKAEQLKALGNAAQMQAEAQKIAAQAEADLKAAQQKLIAAQEAARLAQTQIDKEKAAWEIDKARQELASQIAKNNAEIARIEENTRKLLIQNQDELFNNKKENNAAILTAFSAYRKASENLITKQRNLATQQGNYAQWQAEMLNWEETRPARLEAKDNDIAANNEEIDAYQAQIDYYTKYYGNVSAAKEELEVLTEKGTELNLAFKDASAADKKAYSDAESAGDKVDYSQYATVRDGKLTYWNLKLNELRYTNLYIYYDLQDFDDTKSKKRYKAIKVTESKNGIKEDLFIPLYLISSETKEMEYSYDGDRIMTVWYTEYPSDYYIFTEALYNGAVTEINKLIKNYQEKGVADAQKAADAAKKAYDDAVAADNAYQAAKKAEDAAKTARDAAQKVVVDAGDKATAAQTADLAAKEKAYEDAKKATAAAKTALDKLTTDKGVTVAILKKKSESTKSSLEYAQNDLKAAQGVVSNLSDVYKELSALQSTQEGYIAKWNETLKTRCEAQIAYYKADNAVYVNTNEKKALNDIIKAGDSDVTVYDEESAENKTVKISAAIEILKSNIEYLNNANKTLEAEKAKIEKDEYDRAGEEQTLLNDIQDAQEKVKFAEKRVELTKKAYEDLLNSAAE